jgi:hypothetical protein
MSSAFLFIQEKEAGKKSQDGLASFQAEIQHGDN